VKRSPVRATDSFALGEQVFELSGSFKISVERGNKRALTDFSPGSRANLQRTIAGINLQEAGLPDFATLTYPGEFSKDWRDWKNDLNRWINNHLQVRYAKCWGVWRLEFQKRGAPHFHLLIWDGPRMAPLEVWCPQLRQMVVIADPGNPHNTGVYKWLSISWYGVVKSGDERHLAAGTRIEPIYSINGVGFYTSKYLAKLPDGKFVPVEHTGRFWGCFGRKYWKRELFGVDVSSGVFHLIKRVMAACVERRLALAGGRTRKKRKYYPDEGMWGFLAAKHGMALLNWAYCRVNGLVDDGKGVEPFFSGYCLLPALNIAPF
jgi:hypothetical protein